MSRFILNKHFFFKLSFSTMRITIGICYDAMKIYVQRLTRKDFPFG